MKNYNTVIGQTFEVSKVVPERINFGVLAHLISEVGEVATEIAIVEGDSYKKPDVDGIFGESIDIIICCLDLIYWNTNEVYKNPMINDFSEITSHWEDFKQSGSNYKALSNIMFSIGGLSNSIAQGNNILSYLNKIMFHSFELIQINHPEITDSEIEAKFAIKLAKWKEKALQRVK